MPEFTAELPLPSIEATALPVTKPSLVNAVAAIFGTELMVIFVSAALRCQPSSVSADWVTSATGNGSAAAMPGPKDTSTTTTAPARRSLCTNTRAILWSTAEWFLAPRVAAVLLVAHADCRANSEVGIHHESARRHHLCDVRCVGARLSGPRCRRTAG